MVLGFSTRQAVVELGDACSLIEEGSPVLAVPGGTGRCWRPLRLLGECSYRVPISRCARGQHRPAKQDRGRGECPRPRAGRAMAGSATTPAAQWMPATRSLC